jgi:hypothetical protein
MTTKQIDLERVSNYAEEFIRTAKTALNGFDASRVKYGNAYAFEWADDAMVAAQMEWVGLAVREWIKIGRKNNNSDDLIVTHIREHITSETLRMAKYPTHSTSACTNSMAQYKAAAMAEFLDRAFGIN